VRALRFAGSRGQKPINQRPTSRCREPEPAGCLTDKSNISGGWLRSLTFAFGEEARCVTAAGFTFGACRGYLRTDSARSVVYRNGEIIVSMESGVEVRFPVAENPRLARGTAKQLRNIQISPFGVHWPDFGRRLVVPRAVGRRLRTEAERRTTGRGRRRGARSASSSLLGPAHLTQGPVAPRDQSKGSA
jgi:hypothetical protein